MSNVKPHRRLALTEPTDQVEATGTEATSALHARVQALEARCDQLQQIVETLLQSLEHSAAAPFRVQDETGRTRLLADAGEETATLQLFNAQGAPLAILSATPEGGTLEVRSADGHRSATLTSAGGGVPLEEVDEGASTIHVPVVNTG